MLNAETTTAILALMITLIGALVMAMTNEFELVRPGIILMVIGMGVTNAAVFEIAGTVDKSRP